MRLTKLARHVRSGIHSIRTRLILSYLAIALLPLAILGWLSVKVYLGSMTERVTDYSAEVVNRVAQDIDEYFRDIDFLLTRDPDFYIDQFIKLVQNNSVTNSRKYVFRIWEDFNNLRRVKPGLEDLAITFGDGRILSSYGFYYTDYVPQDSELKLVGPRVNRFGREVVTMVRPYTAEGGRDVWVSADINLERLASMANLKASPRGYVYIMDRDGQIVFSPHGHEVDNSEKVLINTVDSEVTGWKIVSVVYADEVEAELAYLKRLTYGGIILVLVGVGFLAAYLSHAISHPIRRLQEFARQATLDAAAEDLPVAGRDEIAQLSTDFRTMLARIKELMSENLKEQKLLRKLEIESLTNQIKPHFIYNTLDMIIGQLEKEQTEEAIYLIEALGNFFRLSLSQGREVVQVASEIEHVRNYLYIQQLRHGQGYQYHIQVQEAEVLDYLMPRLLLQPLVENAIFHGILPADRPGRVEVVVSRSHDGIVFTVADNGVGMEPGDVEQLNRILAGEAAAQENRPCFGLLNVQKRAQLIFGPSYGLTLDSEPGQGTRTILKIGFLDEQLALDTSESA
ncbi:MAG: sensor histidine kinase [Firmicutes bacterium]|nr:sensor histidine kinase [Bacillota bacterium]